jgi:glutaredoxin
VALESLKSVKAELNFEIEKIYIDGNEELVKMYGEEVPVIHIDGKHHDMFRVDLERFRSSLEKHRQHQ